MKTGDWITVSLTVALVLTTAYYAWQNHRMVEEMAVTRAVSVMPKLALTWHSVSPTMSFVKLINVGPGPALNVDVEVIFVPGSKREAEPDRRHWKISLLASGEQQTFLSRDATGRGIPNLEQLAARYDRIELRGTSEDVLGNSHPAEDALIDIAELPAAQRQAHARWQYPEPEQRQAEALAKKFEGSITGMAGSLAEIASLVRGMNGRGDVG